MELYLFYFFSALIVITSFYYIFSRPKSNILFGICTILIPSAGLLVLFNAVYISFILVIVSALLLSILFIGNYNNIPGIPVDEKENHGINKLQVVILSFTAALIASVVSSSMWQDIIYFKREISLAGAGETISVYFSIFLVIAVYFFLSIINNQEREY